MDLTSETPEDQNDVIDEKVKEDVIKFLRELADKLENNDLTPEASLQISEFFMKFKFVNDALNTIESLEESPHSNDMMKFMSLGWYVYTQLLQKEE
jgi:hypothetical protein